jgi:hypothetical protein
MLNRIGGGHTRMIAAVEVINKVVMEVKLGDEQLAIITRLVRVEFPKFDGNDPSRWI